MNPTPLMPQEHLVPKPEGRFRPIIIGIGYMVLHYVLLLIVQVTALLYFTEQAEKQLGSDATAKELSELAETLFYRQSDLISIITQFLTVFVVVAIFWFIRATKLEEKPTYVSYFSLKKVKSSILGMSALLSCFLYFLVIGFMTVVGIIFPELLENYNESMSSMTEEPNWILNFITLVIGAPLVEELIYRNMAITHMTKRIAPIFAVLISAAVFGVAHGNPLQIIYAAAVGVVFGIIFIRTESIFPSLLGHAVFNGIGFLSSLLSSQFEEGSQGEMVVGAVIMILMLLSLIGGPLVFRYLLVCTKKEESFVYPQYGYPMYYTVSTQPNSDGSTDSQSYNAPQGTPSQVQGWIFDPNYGWRYVGTPPNAPPDDTPQA